MAAMSFGADLKYVLYNTPGTGFNPFCPSILNTNQRRGDLKQPNQLNEDFTIIPQLPHEPLGIIDEGLSTVEMIQGYQG